LERTERTKRWIEGFHAALDATKSSVPVLLGDLNVLEPGHQPEHRQQFTPFEYSFYRALTVRHGLIGGCGAIDWADAGIDKKRVDAINTAVKEWLIELER